MLPEEYIDSGGREYLKVWEACEQHYESRNCLNCRYYSKSTFPQYEPDCGKNIINSCHKEFNCSYWEIKNKN